jgi:hypothetical protein
MTVDEIIKQVNIKSSGRTRYEGKEPYWDEVLVAEIERLQAELDYYKDLVDVLDMQLYWVEGST